VVGNRLLIALSLNELGLVAHHLCDYERAIALFLEAMLVLRELNDRLGISNTLQNMADVIKDQGDFIRAERLYKECLALKQDIGDKRGISRVIIDRAEIAFWQSKYSLADDLARQSLVIARELGAKRVILYSIVLMGFIAFYQGNYEIAASFAKEGLELSSELDAPQAKGYAKELFALGMYAEEKLVEAREQFKEALAIFQQINDFKNVANIFVNLARTSYRQGDDSSAMQYLNQSYTLAKDCNIRWTLGFVFEIMGLLQRNAGNYEQALELFKESLQIAVAQDDRQGIANCVGALAGLAVKVNQGRRAARLFAAAAKLRWEMGAKISGNDRLEYENYISIAHRKLDYPSFEVEWSEGFAMSTEQVIRDLKEWLGDFGNPTDVDQHEDMFDKVSI
jgi:tetratricopeptide (TPR) repeat protein